MDKKWGNKDWIWLVGILITIIILLIAGFYNSKAIEMNFSIISSAVSIALALVAIFIALKQDSDNQRVNDRLSHLLNEISANVRNVDAKVDRIDPRLLHSVSKGIVEEYNQESKEKDSFTKEEVDEIVKNISEDITLNINNLLNQSSSIDNDTKIALLTNVEHNKLRKIVKNNLGKPLPTLQAMIETETGMSYPMNYIAHIRNEVAHASVS
ncbi:MULTISPECIES: hypothetical protein [Bacillus cereus group]|uniref:hypothetical protein n=1 Tax=Bacillus cereus group TaxID=86661 RepID=UPI0009777F7B|nr:MULTISPECIES: hypothetical protein [unclassified Bacillus cereus group]ONG84475.1 hypothetical protein BKK41_02055 [Bacillus cereus]MDA2662978.1 hypothetical protein [Bacillus cereus group sp. Bc032]MDA2673700.1 hypothetical protein [Bacillus cereus group sp. Bc031]MDA2679160.1 hypothetical protein [Bacillus cereus group sp. Bc029]MDA2684669.1 hypothetical protein [Bacillus cereus group sp. Bc030]